MRERFAEAFHPFVIPFLVGMLFVLGYCLVAMVRVVAQLPRADRKRFLLSLITPKYTAPAASSYLTLCSFKIDLILSRSGLKTSTSNFSFKISA